MLGYLAPNLQFLGIVQTYIVLIDLPISGVALMLAWKYGALAAAWIVVVGTLWWYLLSLGAQAFVRRLKVRTEARLSKLS